MRTLTTLVVALLLVLVLAPAAHAQVTPVSCGKYQFIDYPDQEGSTQDAMACFYFGWYPWYAAGNGWQSWMNFINLSNKECQVSIAPFRLGGPTDKISLAVYASFFGRDPQPTTLNAIPLHPGFSFEEKLLYPLNCDSNGLCPTPWAPAKEQLLVGPIQVAVSAPFLRSDAVIVNGVLTAPSDVISALDALDPRKVGGLTFSYTPPGASTPDRQVQVPLTREMDATAKWGGTFSETIPGASGETYSTSFAVMNLSDKPQQVRVSVYDQHEHLVANPVLTDPIQPDGTTGIVLADLFGDFIPRQMIAPDGLFYGKLTFEGADGSPIIPLIIQKVGNTISSRITYQIP